jgi:hypothetical protein
MDRKILLEYYLNKYVIPDYLLIKRIEVVNLQEVKDNRIDVDIQIVTDSESFKLKFNLTESLQELFIFEDKIPQTFLQSPIFKESSEINFDKIKKEIKHYIKTHIQTTINKVHKRELNELFGKDAKVIVENFTYSTTGKFLSCSVTLYVEDVDKYLDLFPFALEQLVMDSFRLFAIGKELQITSSIKQIENGSPN